MSRGSPASTGEITNDQPIPIHRARRALLPPRPRRVGSGRVYISGGAAVKALACAALLLAGLLALGREPVYGGELSGVVRNLSCIAPRVYYNYWRGGQTLARDSDQQDISNALFVAIKAKLPRLLVTVDCPNGLNVIVSIIESTATCLDGFDGDARLSLHRTALVTESKQLQNLETWAKASRFWGPTRLAKQQTLGLMEGFVNAFAADYYSDGNP